jgi:hypothetical protein
MQRSKILSEIRNNKKYKNRRENLLLEQKLIHSKTNYNNSNKEQLQRTKNLTEESMLLPIL